jgi:hypothetical protein
MASAAAAAVPTLGAAGKAAATAAVAGGAWGNFAWAYSRSLYMYDAEFRFDRMNVGYDYANAQQEMFRNDLVMMTELTFRKMGIYTVIGTMGMAIYIAIFCAGRLGLHGPSPPVWIMGLFLTNIAFAFAMAGMGIWLGFHAMWRAKAACVHLNTRKIRLIIPTRKKLDDARKYGSQWEAQKIRDLARIPYICDMVGWKWSGEVPDFEDEDGSDYTGGNGRSSSAPPGKKMKRVPCWIAEEFAQERVGTTGGSANTGKPLDYPPEHFLLYARAQADWFRHDCYARICMFYSFLSFFQGASFYGLGQINIELRAWWPAFAHNFIFAVLHFLMLKFDIITNTNNWSNQVERLPYCQYLGTATIPLAAIGMALDFRVEYSEVAIQFTWVCIFLCYICQIFYSARLVELTWPDTIEWKEDRMGNNWWPSIGNWKVPSAFQHVYYWVSPPPRIATEKGQFDVVRELKEGYNWSTFDGKWEDAGRGEDVAMALEGRLLWTLRQKLSLPSHEKVKALHQKFMEVHGRSKGNQLKEALGQIERELNAIKNMEPQGFSNDDGSDYESGSGSGYSSGSGSDYSSGYGSSGSGKSDDTKMYSQDAPRQHPGLPVFTKFSYVEPWQLVSLITATFAATWVFLTLGMIVDRAVGVQGLMTAPHWSKPPMTRSSKYPWERGTPIGLQVYSGDRPYTPEELFWHENHKHRPQGWQPHWMDYGHEGRRLSATSPSTAATMGKEGMKQAFTSLISSLPSSDLAAELLQRVPTKEEAAALTNLESRFRHTGAGWQPQSFSWPGFFEPKMLACVPGEEGMRHAWAITPRGVAAAAPLGSIGSEAERFILTGLSDYPPLLSASYTTGPAQGLMLVSKKGDLLHCPGARQGSQWACGPLPNAPPRIPFAEGTRLHAASAAWLGDDSMPRLHAAVIMESSPDVVALWALEGNTEAASWLPLGELPVPHRMAVGASLSFGHDGHLLLATSDGATIQRRISDGTVVSSTGPLNFGVEAQRKVQWQAACAMHEPSNRIVHLSMRNEPRNRRPEVMVMRTLQSSP